MRYCDKEDFFQAAMAGAWKAALNFEPERGVKFLTYAAHKMSAECRKLYRECAITHIPPEVFRALPSEERTNQVFYVRSLDAPLSQQKADAQFTLADVLPAEASSDNPVVHNRNLYRLLNKVLKPRELKAIMVHYGFLGEDKTIAELARFHGCTRQAEHQHLTKAVKKLQDAVKNRRQSAFLA